MTALDTKALLEGSTPGPWEIADGGIVWAYGSDVESVAECCGVPRSSGECCGNAVQGWEEVQTQVQVAQCDPSDAALIASAPRLARRVIELEEALEAIRGMIGGYAGQPNLPGDVFKIADATLKGEGDE